MIVFVAGATGAIGRKLVPLLVERGHKVVGMARSPAGADAVKRLGGEPAIADAFDRGAVIEAVHRLRPDVIVHELTAIPQQLDLRNFEQAFAATNRLRTEGTDTLLAAAAEAHPALARTVRHRRIRRVDDERDPGSVQ
jgi:nucleoside-diphosphate-sugar epimerase